MFNHRVGINNIPKSYQKKDVKSRGFLKYYQTDSQSPNDRNSIAGYGCAAFKYVLVTAPPITITSSTFLVTKFLLVKLRANAYRN